MTYLFVASIVLLVAFTIVSYRKLNRPCNCDRRISIISDAILVILVVVVSLALHPLVVETGIFVLCK